jgi:hypothetical protein
LAIDSSIKKAFAHFEEALGNTWLWCQLCLLLVPFIIPLLDIKQQKNYSETFLFGFAESMLKLSQRRSLNSLSTHHHHTNFLGTSRQAMKLIFGKQLNYNQTR